MLSDYTVEFSGVLFNIRINPNNQMTRNLFGNRQLFHHNDCNRNLGDYFLLLVINVHTGLFHLGYFEPRVWKKYHLCLGIKIGVLLNQFAGKTLNCENVPAGDTAF